MEGTPFGRYRLIAMLGRGGMGEVWQAHDTDTDRIVALKLLPPNLAHDADFSQRFRREAHAAARLNNPHIIPIHHYGEIDGRLYVDMRLVEGRDLQAVLESGPIDPERAVRIVEQVAKALQAAHKVGLVHRDVKPSNVLLDDDDFAYLIDFGIARVLDETRLTNTGNAIGTFLYMAPERLGAAGEDDARADIYALACVLYECLTGRPPFAGSSMALLVAAHLNTPPPRPSIARPNVPEQLDGVIEKGLAKNPDNRYSTTVAFAQAAREAITVPNAGTTDSATGGQVRAGSVSPPPPAGPPPQQRPPGAEPSAATRRRPQIDPRPAASAGPPGPGFSVPVAPFNPAAQGDSRAPLLPPPNWRRPETPGPDRARAGRPWWRRWPFAVVVGVAALLLVAGLVIGREIVRSNYYVAAHDGTVSIMRGVPGSILGVSMQESYRHGCLTARNDLNLIAPGQAPTGCQLFRVTDLKQADRAQVEAGLPTGSEDDAIGQINRLAQGSVLPVCLPSASDTSSPPTAPTAPTITTLPPPPVEPGVNCRELG